MKLFIRLGRRNQLTEAGRIIAEYATRLMIVLREMNETIEELKGVRKGQLRCEAATTIAVHLLTGRARPVQESVSEYRHPIAGRTHAQLAELAEPRS